MVQFSPSIRSAFLERLLNDRMAGKTLRLEDYQAAFPGFEELVAWEWSATCGQSSDAASHAAQPRDPRSLPNAELDLAQQLAAMDFSSLLAANDARRLGNRVGPYRLVRELGRGGQGDVFLAEDTLLKRQVALKILRSRIGRTVDALGRFQREVLVAARLDHPGIATIFAAGTIDGTAWVAMRYVEGETIAQRIRRERAEPARAMSRDAILARAALIEKAARAVHAAHEAKIVHRDIKPSNLMVTSSGDPVLLDFGLAREAELEQDPLTRTGDVFGTPAYMAPEQVAASSEPADARSDVYALGVTLYELLTLELPFEEPTRARLFRAIETQEPRNPRLRQPAIPRPLVTVLRTAMAKSRTRRYQTAMAFADDLRAVCEARPIRAVPPSWLTRLGAWILREPRTAALTAGLLFAILCTAGLSGYLLAQRGQLAVGRVELERQADERTLLDTMGYSRSRNEWLDKKPALVALEKPDASPLLRVYLAYSALLNRAPDEAIALAAATARTADEQRAYDRITVQALRDLGKPAAAEAIESGFDKRTFALEQFTAGLLLWRRYETGDQNSGRKALEHFDRAVFLSPRAELIFHLQRARTIAMLYPTNGDLVPMGATSADALTTLWPQSAVAHVWAAQTIYMTDVGRAAAFSKRATELDPTLVEAYVQWGGAEFVSGHHDVAMDCYRQAVQAAEHFAPDRAWMVHWHWAALLVKQPDKTACVTALHEALRLKPDEREPSRMLCRVLCEAEELEAAADEMERRAAVAPKDGYAWFELARLRNELGDAESAHAAAAEADRLRHTKHAGDPDWQRALDELLRR